MSHGGGQDRSGDEATPPQPGRPPGPRVWLPDGSAVLIRAIHRDDAKLLLDHFAHLGTEARYSRFLGTIRHLTAEQLDHFTHPDHRLHEALFALDDVGRPVGVARYISTPERPETAELAAAVVDGWRGRGVGSALVDELARRARNAGIARFTALMLPQNRPMRHVLARLGPLEVLNRDPTGIEVAVALEPRADRPYPEASCDQRPRR